MISSVNKYHGGSSKVCDNSNHLLTLNPQTNSILLGNLRQIDTFPGRNTLLYQLLYQVCAPQRVCFLSPFGLKTDIDFDHSLGMVFKGTTRAYKHMENGTFWSEIGSGFKELGGTPPPKIPRSIPSAYRAAPFQYLV